MRFSVHLEETNHQVLTLADRKRGSNADIVGLCRAITFEQTLNPRPNDVF